MSICPMTSANLMQTFFCYYGEILSSVITRALQISHSDLHQGHFAKVMLHFLSVILFGLQHLGPVCFLAHHRKELLNHIHFMISSLSLALVWCKVQCLQSCQQQQCSFAVIPSLSFKPVSISSYNTTVLGPHWQFSCSVVQVVWRMLFIILASLSFRYDCYCRCSHAQSDMMTNFLHNYGAKLV